MAGRFVKRTTGLTGLAVVENPHEKLRSIYDKTLRLLARAPRDAAYRTSTEKIVNDRLNIVNSEQDIRNLEDKINCGQVEEVIKQAENELSLVRKMLVWKPWEPPMGPPPKDQWRWPPVK